MFSNPPSVLTVSHAFSSSQHDTVVASESIATYLAKHHPAVRCVLKRGWKHGSSVIPTTSSETIELLREHFAPAADKDPADHFSEGVLRYA